MGAVLVELIPGTRYITETGTIMFHRVSIAIGQPQHIDEIKSSLEYYKSMENLVIDKTAERTGIPYNDLEKEIQNELFMLGTTAVKRNFADKVIAVECDAALIKQKKKRLVQPLPFLPPLEIIVSACPLL